MKKNLHWINKITALTALITFSLNTLTAYSMGVMPASQAGGMSVSAPAASSALNLALVHTIPEQTAAAGEIFTAPAEQAVIYHVQDAHTSLEAQQNIKKILEHLTRDSKVDTIFLEGVMEEAFADWIRLFNNDEANQKAAALLARESLIGGAELFLLDHDRQNKNLRILGVENPALYRANLEAYRAVLNHKSESEKFLGEIRSGILTAGSKILNKKLAGFFKEWLFVTESTQDPFRLFKALERMARENLALQWENPRLQIEWPQMFRLLKLGQLEKTLNAGKAREDHERWMKWLAEKKVSEAMQKEAAALGEVLRTAQWASETPRKDLEKIYDELSPLGFSFKDYPALSDVLGSLILRGEIDAQALMQESDRLRDMILDKLAQNQNEKELIAVYKDYLLLKGLLSLELSSEQYALVLNRVAEMQPEKISIRLASLMSSSQTGATSSQQTTAMSFPQTGATSSPHASGGDLQANNIFDHALQFYQAAQKRNEIIHQNMLQKMKALNKREAILITGGFHAKGIHELWKKSGVSFVELTPHLSEIKKDTNYENVMLLKADYKTRLATLHGLSAAEDFEPAMQGDAIVGVYAAGLRAAEEAVTFEMKITRGWKPQDIAKHVAEAPKTKLLASRRSEVRQLPLTPAEADSAFGGGWNPLTESIASKAPASASTRGTSRRALSRVPLVAAEILEERILATNQLDTIPHLPQEILRTVDVNSPYGFVFTSFRTGIVDTRQALVFNLTEGRLEGVGGYTRVQGYPSGPQFHEGSDIQYDPVRMELSAMIDGERRALTIQSSMPPAATTDTIQIIAESDHQVLTITAQAGIELFRKEYSAGLIVENAMIADGALLVDLSSDTIEIQPFYQYHQYHPSFAIQGIALNQVSLFQNRFLEVTALETEHSFRTDVIDQNQGSVIISNSTQPLTVVPTGWTPTNDSNIPEVTSSWTAVPNLPNLAYQIGEDGITRIRDLASGQITDKPFSQNFSAQQAYRRGDRYVITPEGLIEIYNASNRSNASVFVYSPVTNQGFSYNLGSPPQASAVTADGRFFLVAHALNRLSSIPLTSVGSRHDLLIELWPGPEPHGAPKIDQLSLVEENRLLAHVNDSQIPTTIPLERSFYLDVAQDGSLNLTATEWTQAALIQKIQTEILAGVELVSVSGIATDRDDLVAAVALEKPDQFGNQRRHVFIYTTQGEEQLHANYLGQAAEPFLGIDIAEAGDAKVAILKDRQLYFFILRQDNLIDRYGSSFSPAAFLNVINHADGTFTVQVYPEDTNGVAEKFRINDAGAIQRISTSHFVPAAVLATLPKTVSNPGFVIESRVDAAGTDRAHWNIFATDGRYVVATTKLYQFQPDTLRLSVFGLGHPDVSPDGAALIAGKRTLRDLAGGQILEHTQVVSLYNVFDGSHVRDIPLKSPAEEIASDIRFAPGSSDVIKVTYPSGEIQFFKTTGDLLVGSTAFTLKQLTALQPNQGIDDGRGYSAIKKTMASKPNYTYVAIHSPSGSAQYLVFNAANQVVRKLSGNQGKGIILFSTSPFTGRHTVIGHMEPDATADGRFVVFGSTETTESAIAPASSTRDIRIHAVDVLSGEGFEILVRHDEGSQLGTRPRVSSMTLLDQNRVQVNFEGGTQETYNLVSRHQMPALPEISAGRKQVVVKDQNGTITFQRNYSSTQIESARIMDVNGTPVLLLDLGNDKVDVVNLNKPTLKMPSLLSGVGITHAKVVADGLEIKVLKADQLGTTTSVINPANLKVLRSSSKNFPVITASGNDLTQVSDLPGLIDVHTYPYDTVQLAGAKTPDSDTTVDVANTVVVTDARKNEGAGASFDSFSTLSHIIETGVLPEQFVLGLFSTQIKVRLEVVSVDPVSGIETKASVIVKVKPNTIQTVTLSRAQLAEQGIDPDHVRIIYAINPNNVRSYTQLYAGPQALPQPVQTQNANYTAMLLDDYHVAIIPKKASLGRPVLVDFRNFFNTGSIYTYSPVTGIAFNLPARPNLLEITFDTGEGEVKGHLFLTAAKKTSEPVSAVLRQGIVTPNQRYFIEYADGQAPTWNPDETIMVRDLATGAVKSYALDAGKNIFYATDEPQRAIERTVINNSYVVTSTLHRGQSGAPDFNRISILSLSSRTIKTVDIPVSSGIAITELSFTSGVFVDPTHVDITLHNGLTYRVDAKLATVRARSEVREQSSDSILGRYGVSETAMLDTARMAGSSVSEELRADRLFFLSLIGQLAREIIGEMGEDSPELAQILDLMRRELQGVLPKPAPGTENSHRQYYDAVDASELDKDAAYGLVLLTLQPRMQSGSTQANQIVLYVRGDTAAVSRQVKEVAETYVAIFTKLGQPGLANNLVIENAAGWNNRLIGRAMIRRAASGKDQHIEKAFLSRDPGFFNDMAVIAGVLRMNRAHTDRNSALLGSDVLLAGEDINERTHMILNLQNELERLGLSSLLAARVAGLIAQLKVAISA